MGFLSDLIRNPLFLSAAVGWFSAQFIKTIIYIIIHKEFNSERLMGAGGMPSSHSATVCALVTATAIVYGPGGFELPMAVFFAFIVMYDAMGVRRETGEQAKVLNEMLTAFRDMGKTLQTRDPMDQFKELVGHTPLQVLIGAVLGIIMGFVVCSSMGFI